MKGFRTGKDNPRWSGGITINEKGYVRLRTRLHRGKLEHRVVVAAAMKNHLCSDYVFPVLEEDGLPAGFHVNHFDYNKTHNCLGNLQLLQACIHDAISQSYKRFVRDMIKNNWEEYLEWVNKSEPDRWE